MHTIIQDRRGWPAIPTPRMLKVRGGKALWETPHTMIHSIPGIIYRLVGSEASVRKPSLASVRIHKGRWP
jgi:hypothetical protein